MKKFLYILFFLVSIFQTTSAFGWRSEKPVTLYLFWGNRCIHCEREKAFIEKFKDKYSYLRVEYFEIWENKENLDLMYEMARELNIKITGLPVTIIEDKYFVGFLNEQTTGNAIEQAIIDAHQNGHIDLVKNRLKKMNPLPNSSP